MELIDKIGTLLEKGKSDIDKIQDYNLQTDIHSDAIEIIKIFQGMQVHINKLSNPDKIKIGMEFTALLDNLSNKKE